VNDATLAALKSQVARALGTSVPVMLTGPSAQHADVASQCRVLSTLRPKRSTLDATLSATDALHISNALYLVEVLVDGERESRRVDARRLVLPRLADVAVAHDENVTAIDAAREENRA
jgi:hypothetical protein